MHPDQIGTRSTTRFLTPAYPGQALQVPEGVRNDSHGNGHGRTQRSQGTRLAFPMIASEHVRRPQTAVGSWHGARPHTLYPVVLRMLPAEVLFQLGGQVLDPLGVDLAADEGGIGGVHDDQVFHADSGDQVILLADDDVAG
jgi:hypothetical protein